MLRRIARLKFRLMRVNPYVQMFNTGLLLIIAGWRWWYVLAGVGFLAAYLFEKKYGVKGEMDVTWQNSEVWTKYEERFDEIHKAILRNARNTRGGPIRRGDDGIREDNA